MPPTYKRKMSNNDCENVSVTLLYQYYYYMNFDSSCGLQTNNGMTQSYTRTSEVVYDAI